MTNKKINRYPYLHKDEFYWSDPQIIIIKIICFLSLLKIIINIWTKNVELYKLNVMYV